MKLRRIVALVLVFLLIAGCTVTAFGAEAPEKTTYNYVALGDSIAAGFGLSNPDKEMSIQNLSSDPAAILTEEVIANPVANAYPALFGDELKKIGEERGIDVTTTNLSMSGYRASDVAKIITEDGYVSDTITMIFEDFLQTDPAPFQKYHDYTEKYLKDADLVTIHLGGNDILINLIYSMHSEKNPVLNAVSMALCMILLGSDTDFALQIAQEELDKCGGTITFEDIEQAAQMIAGIKDTTKRYLAEAPENVRDVVSAVRTKTPDAKVAIINMFSPYGNSLEYDGKVLDACTVMQNILNKAVENKAAQDGSANIADIIKNEISYPLQYLTAGKVIDSDIKVFNENLAVVAEETGCQYVDISGISNENNLDPHPTAQGHKEIADILTASLTEVVFPGCFDREMSAAAGEVVADFAAAGTVCESSDPSIAWVDENGALNAMKPGTALVTNGNLKYTVTVSDYSDGSPVVGSLKLLTRYNDSMQFYDGHVYLLFTSYQDGVTITVPDLYAGYEINRFYYDDIREDIANGSNHTDKDADKYFTFRKDMKSVTLNRGEIVTIGMYRDFDLTVPQAALGSIENSSLWSELTAAGKATVIENVFRFLETGKISADEVLDRIKAVLDEEGLDYTKLLDGVVDGGVCFNRELYNQKLEWDQFENVTYETDITANQLNMMAMYLRGNLNNFSIFKNSCATVALRAWNAAVGTRDGADTSYKLTSEADGIFRYIDAPKGVRDNIIKRLPGYYLNNDQGVAEPDAGFEDETGWVYVSAPESVSPVEYVYDNDAIKIDEFRTSLTPLINAAKAGQGVSYNKDQQTVGVNVKADSGVISGIDFTVNDKVVTLNDKNMPEGSIWFKAKINNPGEDGRYFVTDADGKALASEYDPESKSVSFCVDSLPQSYRIMSASEGAQNILRVTVDKAPDAKIDTEVYYYKDGEKVTVDSFAALAVGTEIFVKAEPAADEFNYMVDSISVNGQNIFDDSCYVASEGAYRGSMPDCYAELAITGVKALVKTDKPHNALQLFVGDQINIEDYAKLYLNDDESGSVLDMLKWVIIDDEFGAVSVEGKDLKAVNEGKAVVWACAKDNENIGVLFVIEVGSQRSDYVAVTFNDKVNSGYSLRAVNEDGADEVMIPYSGYYVKKGYTVNIVSDTSDSKAVFVVMCNGKALSLDEKNEDFVIASVTADTELDIAVIFADAEIKNMPEEIKLASPSDSYQLDVRTGYKGIAALVAAYDGRISYVSSSSLVKVDENGLITVNGDIPEEGAVAIVTASSVSSPAVSASVRVVLGDYQGDKIVGKVTVYARPIYQGELIPHGSIYFTTYDDVDLDVSYYEYYKPNDSYNALMLDYREHPENYTSDPALYNNNELGLTDRESYFDVDNRGVMSEPVTISLKSGESITVSNFSFDPTYYDMMIGALENSDLSSSSRAAQVLIEQMKRHHEGEEIDSSVAFDSLIATLSEMSRIARETGENPANGHSEGGLVVNREIYNQFRRDDSQMPNYYYTVDITADELAILKAYLANPANNRYSLPSMNCATNTVKLWNSVNNARPELMLKGNYTGLIVDPESLYAEVGQLIMKDMIYDYYGHGGKNLYPVTVAHPMSYSALIDAIDALGEPEVTDAYKAQLDTLRKAYEDLSDTEKAMVTNIDKLTEAEKAYEALKERKDAEPKLLGDADGNGIVNVGDATYIQMAIAKMLNDKDGNPIDFSEMDPNDAWFKAADVDQNGTVNVGDATAIQLYAAHMDAPEGIGDPF